MEGNADIDNLHTGIYGTELQEFQNKTSVKQEETRDEDDILLDKERISPDLQG